MYTETRIEKVERIIKNAPKCDSVSADCRFGGNCATCRYATCFGDYVREQLNIEGSPLYCTFY